MLVTREPNCRYRFPILKRTENIDNLRWPIFPLDLSHASAFLVRKILEQGLFSVRGGFTSGRLHLSSMAFAYEKILSHGQSFVANVVVVLSVESSLGMYWSSSKLPQWQNRGSSLYIRRGLLKRYRTIIFLFLFIFFWRRYSSSFRSGYSENEENVTPYTSTLENLDSHPLLKVRNTVTEIAPVYQPQERQRQRRQNSPEVSQKPLSQVAVGTSLEEETKIEAEQLPPVAQEGVIANSKLAGAPAAIDSDPQVLVVKNPESEQLKEEPEDDEAPEKSASSPKPKVRTNTESSLDRSQPPLPVLEASQKVIEQPSSLAVKENPEGPVKTHQNPEDSPRFPHYEEFLELTEKAEGLPDIVHITYEEAPENITLVGWEDAWFSDVEFDVQKWGRLSEPKIDFVYTCKV
jgi:hypothetical protein